ncbi:MAG: SCO family protein [Lewinellaceae bacterium]|nr:SCO family protein [Saprospiraceae bacterium]MCB9317424.1 SCO family protein [Lewinellaceae bacterium]MCB9333704.1 SCO family protein [Lewinellaceae bacterium]
MKHIFIFGIALVLFTACNSGNEQRTLPILGNRVVVGDTLGLSGLAATYDTGAAIGDTLYPIIPDFAFVDQDSQVVTNATFKGKIYVADFFFIHCPTICPKVKANGLRIYKKYENDDRIVLLSHSIDVKNDTVAALKRHAEKLGIQTNRWHLVTGDHDAIYGIADDYFSVATENPDAPGGFDHSGRLILVDKNKHVRSFCNGTDAEDVDRFMKDIDVLLAEQFGSK